MTPTEISNRARDLKTAGDLLVLMNDIRTSGEHHGLRKIKLGELLRYCNPGAGVTRYKTFTIPKKSGGERVISAPVLQLKAMLWPVNEILRSMYEPKPCVMGFTQCRSIVDNAEAHLGQNYILNLDLKDFFPSIRQARVWKRLQLPPFSFTQQVANVIAGLCSMEVASDDGTVINVLPQGAPTSPIITNIICEKLDRRLTGVAARFNLRYTRYADDMTFSSMHSTLSEGGEAFKEICRVITEQGFTINEKKTRLQKRGARQEVTGLILSNKVNTSRKYVRDLDQILYVWEKFGYEAAYVRLMTERAKTPNKVKGAVSLENVISGKLDFLKMVKGTSDKVYIKYHTLFERLVKDERKSTGGTVYLATYMCRSFETLFNTKLVVGVNEDRTRLSFEFAGNSFYVIPSNGARSILDKKDVKQDEVDGMYISLCREGDRLFWQAHSALPQKDEPVCLKLPVEKLIDIWEKDGIEAAMAAELSAHNGEISASRKRSRSAGDDLQDMPSKAQISVDDIEQYADILDVVGNAIDDEFVVEKEL